MEKIYVRTTILQVFENPEDEEDGIPPLFCAEVEFTNLDMERLKQVPNLKFDYQIKNPLLRRRKVCLCSKQEGDLCGCEDFCAGQCHKMKSRP